MTAAIFNQRILIYLSTFVPSEHTHRHSLFFFFFFFNTAYLTPSPSQPSPTFQLRQSTQPSAFHSYVYIMKSPAWILIPSAIILVYSYLVIVPGVFDFDFPSISSINLHSLQLSPEAQQAVRHQTGNSAPGYVVHLFNYCEYYYVDPERPDPSQMKVTCPNSPSLGFYFDFQTVLGIPDKITQDQSSTQAETLAEFNSSLKKFKRTSILYAFLTLVMVFSRLSLVSLIVPLRLAQLRLPYDRSSTLQNRFLTLRGLFSLSYIFTFVSANLQVALAMLHYRTYFYKGMYDTMGNAGVETTLSKSALAYTFIVLILGYIELYPAITYMSQRPSIPKGFRSDPMDDPEAHDLDSLNVSFNSATSETFFDYSEASHEKYNTTTHVVPGSSSAYGHGDYEIESICSCDESLASLTTPSLPSLQACSTNQSGFESTSSVVSEVSTTFQYGDIHTTSSSSAPSIRSMSSTTESPLSR